jgi:ParB family transcriptional regulator, chromosome partitioning protein
MQVDNLLVSQLIEAPFNPNHMDDAMLARLSESLDRFGVVQNLVVRRIDQNRYEVLSGNQRLQLLAERGVAEAPCVIVDVDDAQARLLIQALNRVQGDDDIGLKAELIREVLGSMGQEAVLSLLPESAESLAALSSLGEINMAEHLQAWDKAQAARLSHMTFQLSRDQVDLVEEAMETVMAGFNDEAEQANPNKRGNALYQLCRAYMYERGSNP